MGGSGSGWYAENGHVAGSQGGAVSNRVKVPSGYTLTKDMFGNERITTSTKATGGSVSIYQRRSNKGDLLGFRINTGTHNVHTKTLDEAVNIVNKNWK